MLPTKKSEGRPARRVLNTRRTLVIGHRGFRDAAPENTLPSFELALKAGVDLVEFDYRHTSDGVPVAIHDETLERTTDAQRVWKGIGLEVAGRTLKELADLDAGSWFHPRFAGTRIPTLEEAIDAIRPGAVPLIERKDGDATACAQLFRRRGLVNHAIVIAFDWDYLREFRALVPDQILGALGPSAATRRTARGGDRDALSTATLDRIARMGIELVVWNRHVSRASVAAAHARGMKVWIYTVNDPDEADDLVHMGVDGLISDNPSLIWKTLALRC